VNIQTCIPSSPSSILCGWSFFFFYFRNCGGSATSWIHPPSLFIFSPSLSLLCLQLFNKLPSGKLYVRMQLIIRRSDKSGEGEREDAMECEMRKQKKNKRENFVPKIESSRYQNVSCLLSFLGFLFCVLQCRNAFKYLVIPPKQRQHGLGKNEAKTLTPTHIPTRQSRRKPAPLFSLCFFFSLKKTHPPTMFIIHHCLSLDFWE
jgi:hypothetical protein